MIFIIAITIGIVVVVACIIIATLPWYIYIWHMLYVWLYIWLCGIYIDYGKDYGMYGLYGITYGIYYGVYGIYMV